MGTLPTESAHGAKMTRHEPVKPAKRDSSPMFSRGPDPESRTFLSRTNPRDSSAGRATGGIDPPARSGEQQMQPVQLVADAAPLHGNHWANRYVEAAIIVIGIAVGIALLRFAEGFFVPLLVGLLTSYVLGPLVSGLQRLHVPRAIGAAIVLVAVATLAAGIVYALSDDAARIADQLPSSAKKLREMLHEQIGNKPNPIASVHKAAAELDRAAKEASGTTLVAAVRNVPSDTNGVARLEGYLVAGTSGALLRISEFCWH